MKDQVLAEKAAVGAPTINQTLNCISRAVGGTRNL